MGMDISGKSGTVHLSWSAWSEMQEILRANGFTGSLPENNNDEILTPAVAKEVGRAMLRWYQKKPKNSAALQFTATEVVCLAYALLLCCDDGECEHG